MKSTIIVDTSPPQLLHSPFELMQATPLAGMNILLVSIKALALTLLLSGCEAKLNLEAVEQLKQQSIRRTDNFQAVVANDKTVVAVANDGVILLSSIDNIDWQRKVIEGEPSFVDVVTCPDQSFAALSMDKTVWIGSVEGQQWRPIPISTREDLLSLTCAPDNSLWLVGSFSTVIHSTDKHNQWHAVTLDEDSMLTSIQFVDAMTVYVTGEFGLVARSDDGGKNWNDIEYAPDDFYIHGAYFRSATEGWIGGLSGRIFYTADAGVNWTRQTTPNNAPIYGFKAASQGLYAYGDHNTLLKNNGEKWASISVSGKPVYIGGIEFIYSGVVILAGGVGTLLNFDFLSPSFLAEQGGQ